MIKCKTILLWLFCTSFVYSSNCYDINTKIYNYNVNDSITTFILLNYNFIVSDIKRQNGEYLESLLIQLNLKKEDKNIRYLMESINSSDNAYDFAMTVTKGIN